MLRVLSSFGLVFYSLLYNPEIALLRVSGEKIFFGDFRYSIIFILLIILHGLVYVPVLLRVGIFQITLRNNVSGFATAVTDNIVSGFLWKTFLRVFFILFRETVVLVPLLDLTVFNVTLVVI